MEEIKPFGKNRIIPKSLSPLPYSITTVTELLSMAFPRSLDTKAMSERPPIMRFQTIFYAMLLNEAKKLGVLHGPRLRSLEVALTELLYEARFRPKSSSEKGARADYQGDSLSGGVVADDAASEGHYRVHSQEKLSVTVCAVSMAFPPTHSTREMANYVKDTFTWRWRSASRPPRPLPEDFNVLCPCFSLAEAEATAAESELPEIVQATFYAMLLNEMLELGVVHEYKAERMKSLLVGLRWSTFEVWMHIMDEVIRGAQLHRQPDEVEVRGARNGQGEGSGSADSPAPSSDEE
ncbi:hypothetical protein Cgig2_027393 [Carnegiea gigantea]|uniref:Uncharacterized protein n=1 Tax=Carnegiea gigantea TaxID=171969 RepID=A0A9Q1QC56_9CARY|nr:hypothetical protein Cgig2_027393 [Carnegiea gigantea]